MKILYLGVDNLSCNGIFYILEKHFSHDSVIFASVTDEHSAILNEKHDVIIVDSEAIKPYGDVIIDLLAKIETPILVLAVDNSLMKYFHERLPYLKGMINRNGNAEFLIRSISLIANGGFCYSWDVFDCINLSHAHLNEDMYAKAGLTRREREILKFCLAGETNKSISLRLSRSEKTISSHKSNISRKLGVKGWQLKGPYHEKVEHL